MLENRLQVCEYLTIEERESEETVVFIFIVDGGASLRKWHLLNAQVPPQMSIEGAYINSHFVSFAVVRNQTLVFSTHGEGQLQI